MKASATARGVTLSVSLRSVNSGGIFTTAQAECSKLSAKWVDFLTNTGNGERTKLEKEKWLAEHHAFSADLVEIGGKKFEPDNKADARRVAELLGLVVEKDETTEDATSVFAGRNL